MLDNFCILIVEQIFVWSMKTAHLLDVLSGHEGPVHGLVFSPTNVSFLRFWVLFYCSYYQCLS